MGRLPWALLLLGAAFTGVACSPWLRVREVEISGLGEAGGIGLVGAIQPLLGKPLLSLAPFKTAEALERRPQVREVKVALRLPGTVRFVVREREAVFWVRVGRGRGLALSADGVAIRWTEGAEGLCRLEGVSPPSGPGDVVGGSEFLPLRSLYFALKRAGVRGVEAVGANGRGELFACLKNGTVITFGEPVQLRAKAERARALLHFLGSRRVRAELLSPDLAIWRPLEGVEGGR